MSFKSLMLVVPFLSFVALTGCGPTCEGLCDDAKDNDCKNSDHDGCIQICTMAADMKDDTDKCSTEYDDLLTCMNDASDICDFYETEDDGKRKKCNSEATDYADCFAEYCMDHTSRDYCTGG